jgi:peptidoglycan biosynthesis protein MviN/MurJ (putative lipid II flippase)
MVTNTLIPVVVGLILGALGSVLFIMRSRAFTDEDRGGYSASRQSAVRRVLIIYAYIAAVCLVAAVAIGDFAFILLTGAMALIALAGLARLWSPSR